MDELSEIFKMLGDPTRLRIMRMLAENGEICVCKIQEALGVGQSVVSHHMAALRHAGLVFHRRDGQRVMYRINEQAILDGPAAYLHNLMDALKCIAA
jgi:ArsR family transcriptional regulator